VLGAVVMAVLTERQGWSAGPAIIIGLLTGAVCGFVNGIFVSILRIPSFIVTLATYIITSGLTLVVLQGQTTQGVANPFIVGIAGTPTSYFTNALGIGLPTIAVLLYIANLVYGNITRKRAGLKTLSTTRLIVQSVFTFVIVEGTVTLLQSFQGVPYAIGIFFAITILIWLALTKTSWGRHVYATGGNTEAARRAGINVVGIRIVIFVLCSIIAVLATIIDTSRLAAVSSNIGSMQMLNIIAAAVIGGVSLFGGRGSVWSVVLGMLIVTALANGLALLNQSAEVQEIAEGLVLLLAVTADALIRRAQARSRSGR
jgi:D-xylose transport system permease protein